jgi:hypothetical protein
MMAPGGYEMPSYNLRNVPAPLWREFKKLCEADRRTARAVLLELIRVYVKRGGKP